MRRHLIRLTFIAVIALALGASTASASVPAGAPRSLVTAVGEQKGIRLLSNDAKGWHWVWLRKPSARIVLAHPPQRLPENDEAVNGLSGRTGVYVTGRRPGTASALLGYVSADGSKLFKTVVLRIVVE